MADQTQPTSLTFASGSLLGRASALAVAYFAAAELGHWLSIEPGHFATFWPPAGVYLAVLLRTERRDWWVFVLAAMGANLASDVLFHDKTVLVSLGFSLANGLEAMAGAWCIGRWITLPFSLHRLIDVLVLTLVTAAFSSVLGATLGAAIVARAFGASFGPVWQVWWIADVVGVLVMVPLVLTALDHGRRIIQPIRLPRALEAAALLVVLTVVGQIVFGSVNPVLEFPYFVLPLLVWAALRFGVGGVSLAVFVISISAVRHTVEGDGPFVNPGFTTPQQVLLVQAFICMTALCSLTLAAVTQERRDATQKLAEVNVQLESRVEARTAEVMRASEELRESQRRLATLLAHLPGMAYRSTTTPPWPLTFVSDGVFGLTGRTAQDFVEGRCSWLDIMHPDDLEMVGHEVTQAIKEKRLFSLVYRIRHVSGEERWVLDHGQPIYADDGSPIAFEGFVGDLTEQKRAEKVLRQSEERFRATFDRAAVGVAHVGLDGRTLWVNPGLCAMLGFNEQELLAMSIMDVTHPDDIQNDLALAQRLIAQEIPSYRIEKRYLHKSGSVVWGDLAVSLVRDLEGRPKYVVGIVVDVTERKQVQSWLEAVLASINDHLVCFDRQGRYTFVNDRAAQVLGKRKDELLGRSMDEVYQDSNGSPYSQELHQAQAEQRVIRSEHYFAPAGKWFENHVYPSPDGVTVFSADVTWRKNLEQELRQRAEQLAEADRRKDEFLATLAHELRNPLAPIRNALQIIGLARDNQGLVDQARNMMERQVTQMVRLIDDLLDVSRISRNKLELRKEWVELAVAVQNAVETARPHVEAAGHQLTISLPPQPVLLHADLTRLSQVFLNLLTNAAKYTESGGSIVLRAECEGSDLVVSVRDSGIGIPADKLPHIFDLFVQVDRSLERSQSGLGIGLTLVKRLVEMHGGSITAHSEGAGQGSEFVIRLPLSTYAAQSLAHPVEPTPTGAIRGRILVVDDNRDSAASLAMMLQLRGADVRTAYDGLEALEVASQFRPDLILLDIGMPRLNGYDAARRLRELPWCDGIRLIAMTGWGQEDDKRRALESGFDYHLTKPVDTANLVQLIQQLVPGPPRGSTAEPSGEATVGG